MSIFKTVLSLILLFTLSLHTSFTTAAPTTELEPIVISADLFEKHQSEVSQSIHIITAKDIERTKPKDLLDVLRTVPGLYVNSLGTSGEDTDIRLRGQDRDGVLVMIDGMAINNFLEARPLYLNTLPVALIERVEVIKGALSALYGSEAAAGVINIVTKSGSEDFQAGVSFQAGNLESFQEGAWARGSHKKFSYAVGYERLDQKGRFSNDRFGQHAFFFNTRFDFSDVASLSTKFLYLRNKQELAYDRVVVFAAPVLVYILKDENRFAKRDMLLPQLSFDYKPSENYQLKASYGLFFLDQNNENSNVGDTTPSAAIPLNSQLFHSRGYRHVFDVRNRLHVIDNAALKTDVSFGVASTLEFLKVEDDPFPGDTVSPVVLSLIQDVDTSRRNIAVYGQMSHKIYERLSLAAGLRYDYNTTYGKAFSPRVSLSYFIPGPETKIFATFSQGYRAPTVSEYTLTLSDGTGIRLAQSLQKEKTTSYEVGLLQNIHDRLSFGFTFFYNDFDGLIDFVKFVDQAHASGFELSLNLFPFEWLRVHGHYTFTESVDDSDGSALTSRPDHMFYGALTVSPLKGFTVSLESKVYSSQLIPDTLSTEGFGDLPALYFDENAQALGTTLPGYYVVNIAAVYTQALRHNWLRELRYSLRLNNLTNQSYQESPGYPQARFTVLAGLEARY